MCRWHLNTSSIFVLQVHSEPQMQNMLCKLQPTPKSCLACEKATWILDLEARRKPCNPDPLRTFDWTSSIAPRPRRLPGGAETADDAPPR